MSTEATKRVSLLACALAVFGNALCAAERGVRKFLP